MSGKKFRFSLESVRRLRRHETERAEQHLGQIVRARRKQEQRVAAARQHLDDLTRTATHEAPSANLHRLRQRDAYRQQARHTLRTERKTLNELKQREEEARAHLLEKRHAEERLQTLYEQEKAQHKKEMRDAEAAFMDDQAVMRHRHENLLSL